MKAGHFYEINLSSAEYPIRMKGEYLREGPVVRFHIFKTIEICPREVTLHEHQILGRYKPDVKKLDAYKDAR